jgi:hypothetical protein
MLPHQTFPAWVMYTWDTSIVYLPIKVRIYDVYYNTPGGVSENVASSDILPYSLCENF